MKPKFLPILEMCIESGLKLGHHRAHKHNDKPDTDTIIDAQYKAIMGELYEWFDMEIDNACE